jgi:hypothetical protein
MSDTSQNEQQEATARPWRIPLDAKYCIEDASGKVIAAAMRDYSTDGRDRANAALIVKAVNAHGPLVAALENIQADMRRLARMTYGQNREIVDGVIARTEAALAQAGTQ